MSCGTYGGYQAHRKRGEEACGPCRAACAVYHQDYRDNRADVRESNRLDTRARQRARVRLAAMYPADFRRLYLEELETADELRRPPAAAAHLNPRSAP